MCAENLQTIAIIVAAISASAAAVSAIYSARSSNTTLVLYKKEKREKLIEELNKILEIGIQYPYLESKAFTSNWDNFRLSDDERYLRYDMYCNLLFNYLNHVFTHFEYDKKQVEGFVDIKSCIRIHKYNWLNPVDENENIDGYDEKFKIFINSYIK